MRDTFILGAGFSCAISEVMPTTNGLAEAIAFELSEDVRFAHLVDANGALPDPDVERWLSRLAERHPFDDAVTYQYNQATFAAVSRVIARAIRANEAVALSRAGPFDWLTRLVEAWQTTRATVATFNYDTFVETTFNSAVAKSGNAHAGLPPGGLRMWAPTYGAPGSAEGFSLCKLHGSINWFWHPDGVDRGVVDVGVDEQWSQFGPPMFDPDELSRRAGTREPFIVPPTSLKGPFFQHDTLRHHWTTARLALERAERVFVIGYSLPQTDLVAGSLLAAGLIGRTVVVVNRSPNDVVARIESLTNGAVDIDVVDGADAVQRFATAYAAEVEDEDPRRARVVRPN